MAKKTNKSTFEIKLSRLEEISALLENSELGLEEAISLYEEGIKLSQECMGALKHAELKITELKKDLDSSLEEEQNSIEE